MDAPLIQALTPNWLCHHSSTWSEGHTPYQSNAWCILQNRAYHDKM